MLLFRLPRLDGFWRTKMWYSYKRWASRPITLDLSRQAMWEALFSVKLSKIIHKFEVIVNIDESAFNRSIKWNYFWAPRGSTVPIWNSCFGKSFGLISAITTEGLSFSLIRTGTTNSKCIVDFIENLVQYLK